MVISVGKVIINGLVVVMLLLRGGEVIKCDNIISILFFVSAFIVF